ncbi:MAG: IMP cyclohydrolase [Candidatus Hydrogenedentes bacterium]|nr:IMP cyclohydrolase [Candidatus Hydrogenedentota bacterium]
MTDKDLKQMYRTRTEGEFPATVDLLGRTYAKVEDLRYGTNPHQPAAFYRPVEGANVVLGGYRLLKTGKSGLSQTNLEDIHHAAGILKYLSRPACAIMKHCNPSGVAMQHSGIPAAEIYYRAREADPQAAFGGVAVLNCEVNTDCAVEMMRTVIEGVAAPGFTDGALQCFHDFERFKRNKDIRIVKLPDFGTLPKFLEDDTDVTEIKVFDDGSLVLAKPYLSRIRSADDLVPAYADHKTKGRLEIARTPTTQEADDLLFAWYVNIHVRSNGCVIAKNGETLAVGTGQQDRVGAVEQAIAKAQTKYKGAQTLDGAVIASDGFFPFRDSVDIAARAGIRAFVQPGGSVNDYEVVEACNEAGAAMAFTMERCFSHH